MVHVLVRHKVEDFDKWKAGFEAALEFRKSSGEKSFQVFQDADDPNLVTVLNEWNDLDSAKKFIGSDELKEKMKAVGVLEPPQVFFLNEA